MNYTPYRLEKRRETRIGGADLPGTSAPGPPTRGFADVETGNTISTTQIVFPDRISGMPRSSTSRRAWLVCLLLGLPQLAAAHGSVALEDDLCAIKIGYFKAHFKIFLPELRQHEEFCEDIPETGDSVFVMEYLHSGLGAVPLDFRIIRDVTGLGRFARWEDVQNIDDIDAATVFYQEPRRVPDVFTVMHEFDEPGSYIGIVTTAGTEETKAYYAVFPFEVGFTGFGYWPLFAGLAILLQLNYMLMSGRFRRWIKPRIMAVESPSDA